MLTLISERISERFNNSLYVESLSSVGYILYKFSICLGLSSGKNLIHDLVLSQNCSDLSLRLIFFSELAYEE